MKNVCIFDVSRVKMFHGSEQDGYEAAKIIADQANIVAVYNWRNAPTERKFLDFLNEFEGSGIGVDTLECRPRRIRLVWRIRHEGTELIFM